MAAQLSDKLKETLDSKMFVTVATVQPDGSPQLSPVWVTHADGDVLISTTEDRRKTRNLARDPRVTVMVNPAESPYSYAEIRGTAELVPDPEGRLIDELSLKYTGKRYAEFNSSAGQDAPRVVVRITPQKIVGQGLD
ncbi:TIGR03618 family F420-dependent PPOX class oxidoreductase [Streptomyces spiramenti]|uniref:PPOX class F420-dependent oxidoreductase n=1 Tax=Streptomyces spiramenti TaxID=2720606 RepID=A0ABX1AIE7_9ACTN|nr:PPOX class F420-dependent oxidoreductase [Streptomyces spiramenti]